MKKPLIIEGYGYFISLSQDNFILRNSKKDIEEQQTIKETAHVVIRGGGIALSSDFLLTCARRSIPIILLDHRNRPTLVFSTKTFVPTLLKLGKENLHFITRLIKDKIRRQHSVISYHARSLRKTKNIRDKLEINPDSYLAELNKVYTYLSGKDENVKDDKRRKILFLIEARAASNYWRSFSALLEQKYFFHKRTKHHPSDPVNQLLNYGYAMLFGIVAGQAIRFGINLSVSLLHHRHNTYYPLLFDLIEPFRPIIDHIVMTFLHRQRRDLQDKHGNLKQSVLRRFRRSFSKIANKPQPWLRSKQNLQQIIDSFLNKAPNDLWFTGRR